MCHFQCQDNCRHNHTYEAANAYLPTASSRLLNWNNFALLFLEFVPWPCKEKPVVEGYVTFVSNFEPVNLQIHHSNKFSLDWSLISLKKTIMFFELLGASVIRKFIILYPWLSHLSSKDTNYILTLQYSNTIRTS